MEGNLEEIHLTSMDEIELYELYYEKLDKYEAEWATGWHWEYGCDGPKEKKEDDDTASMASIKSLTSQHAHGGFEES